MQKPKKHSGNKNYYDDELSREAVGKLFADSAAADDDIDFEEEGIVSVRSDVRSAYVNPLIKDAEPVDDEDYVRYMTQTAKTIQRNSGTRKRRLSSDADIDDFDNVEKRQPVSTERVRRTEPAASRIPVTESRPARSEGYATRGDVEEIEMSFMDVVSVYKYPIIGISAVILLIFGFLVFRINSVNSDYKEAVKRAEANSAAVAENQGLLINIDNLRSRVDELTSERDDYKQLYDELEEQRLAAIAANTPTETDEPTPTETAPTGTTSGTGTQRTHKVVSGDSFWKLAIQYYGDGSKYKDIMTANNYTDENGLKVDVTIIIP